MTDYPPVLDEIQEAQDHDETIDLTSYKTAAGAAKALHKFLTALAIGLGDDPSGIILRDPDSSEWNGWEIIWEGGPYEWAYAATSGSSIFQAEYGAELAGFGGGSFSQEIIGATPDGNPDLTFEPGYSFSLTIHQN